MARVWTQSVGKPAGLGNVSSEEKEAALSEAEQGWPGHRPAEPLINPQTKRHAQFHHEPVHTAAGFPHWTLKALLAPTLGRRKGQVSSRAEAEKTFPSPNTNVPITE